MTRDEFAPRLPFLQAWMDGKEVECVPVAVAYIRELPWCPVVRAEAFTRADLQFRLKPQPREWWICDDCKSLFSACITAHVCGCNWTWKDQRIVHVREVLPDSAGGAA